MSTTVDQRVVEMKFDNANFEKNVSTSMSTLDKLKQKLNFSKSVDSLSAIEDASKKISFKGLSDNIEEVGNKFNVWTVMAFTAIQNITNDLMNWGKNLVKSLTITPVLSGWQKYQDKTSAVQTIMASTNDEFRDTETHIVDIGRQMEYVNEQLELLGWFTDETSYGFVDMVSNIGKFTSNSIKLEDATTSMMGIATWAAISGQNASTASRAMYNLAQAVGMGAVKMQDWRSIELASMATAEFKQAALDAAVEAGTLTKTLDGVYKAADGTRVSIENFSSTLATGWFTAGKGSVLERVTTEYGKFAIALHDAVDATGLEATQLLQAIHNLEADDSYDFSHLAEQAGTSVEEFTGLLKYLTDDTFDFSRKAFEAAQMAKTFTDAIEATKDAASSNWMNIFEAVFGDFLQAKELWTQLSTDLWNIFIDPISNLASLTKDAFGTTYYWDEAGNKLTEEMYRARLEAENLEKSLGKSDEEIDAMVSDWKAASNGIKGNQLIAKIFANTIGLIGDYLVTIREAWRNVFQSNTADNLFDLTLKVSNFFEALRPTDQQLEQFGETLESVFEVTKQMLVPIGTLIKFVGRLTTGLFGLVGGAVANVFNYISESIQNLTGTSSFLEATSTIIDGFSTTLKGLYDLISKRVKGAATSVQKFWNAFKGSNAYKNTIGKISDTLDSAVKKLGEYFKIGTDGSSDFLDDMNKLFTNIDTVISNVSTIFGNFFKKVKSWFGGGTGDINNFSTTVSGLTNTLETKNPIELLKSSLEDLKAAGEFDVKIPFVDRMSEFFDKVGTTANEIKPVTNELKTASSVTKLLDKYSTSVTTAVTNFFDDFGAKDLTKLISSIGLTTIFVRLDKTIKNFSTVLPNFKAVTEKTAGAIDKLGTSGSKYLNSKVWTSAGTALLMIAGAIFAIATSMFIISKIPDETLVRSVGIVTAIVAAMGGLFIAIMNMAPATTETGDTIKSSISLFQAALGMIAVGIVLMTAIKALSKLADIKDDLDGIGKAFLALLEITGLMVAVAIAVNKMPGLKIGRVLSLLAVVLVLRVLIKTLEKIGDPKTREKLESAEEFIKDNLVNIVSTIAGFLGMAYLASQAAGVSLWNLLSIPIFLVTFAGSLLIASVLMKRIDLEGLVTEMGMLAVLLTIVGKLPVEGKLASVAAGLFLFGIALIAFSLGIRAMSKALESVSESSDLWKVLGTIAGLGFLVAALGGMFSLWTGLNGQVDAVGIFATCATILSLSLLIKIVIDSLLDLTTIPLGKLVVSMLAMGLLIGALGTAIEAASHIGKDQKGVIGVFIALGLFIGAMALVLEMVADAVSENPAGMLAATGIFALFVIALGGIMLVAEKLAKSSANIGMAIGILATFGAVIGTIGGVVYALATLDDPLGVLAVALAVGALMAVLVISVNSLQKLAEKSKKHVDIKPIIALAGAIAAIGSVIAVLALIKDPASVAVAVGAIAAVMLGLYLVLRGLSNLKVASAAAQTTSLIALGGVIAALAGVMVILGKVTNWNELAVGATALGASVVMLIGAAFAMKQLGSVKINLKNALALVVMLVTVAGSIVLLSKTLGSAGSGGFKALWPALVAIAAGLGLMVGALAALGAISGLVTAAGTGLMWFSLAVLALGSAIGVSAILIGAGLLVINAAISGLAGSTKRLAESVDGNGEKIGNAFGESIRAALDAVSQNSEDFGRSLGKIFGSIVTFAAGAISELAGDIANALLKLLSAAIEALATALDAHGEELYNAVVHLIDVIKRLIVNAINNNATYNTDIERTIGHIIEDAGDKTSEAVINAVVALGEDYIRAYNEMVPGVIDITKYGIEEIAEETTDAIDEAGDEVMESVNSEVEEKQPEIKGILTGLVSEDTLSSVKDFLNEKLGYEVPDEMVDTFLEYLGINVEEAEPEVEEIMETVIETAGQATVEEAKEQAENVVDGYTNVFQRSDLLRKVYAAGHNIASKFDDGFKNYMEIRSPSRLMAQNGKYTVEGLINGLKGNVSKLTIVGKDLGKATEKSISDTIADIADIINFGEFENPVIRPVVDLTGVEEGFNTISSMGDNYRMSYGLANANAGYFGNSYSAENAIENKLDKLTDTVVDMLRKNSTGMTNNFNITGEDPEEIANKVADIIQNLVNQKETQWA